MKRILLLSVLPLSLFLASCSSNDSETSDSGDAGACQMVVDKSADSVEVETLQTASDKAEDVTLSSVLAEAGEAAADGNTDQVDNLLATVTNYCHRIVLEDEQSE